MIRFVLPAIAALLLACSGGAGGDNTTPPATSPPATPTDSVTMLPPEQSTQPMATDTVAPQPGATSTAPTEPPSTDPAIDLPLWQTAELRDVRTGATFRVSDFADKVVVVEPMAIWCSSCRAQQDAAREALAGLPADQIVYISLDVDPNETEPDLASYAEERGYPWLFAVASVDVARSLAQTFGDQVLSPPSTPKIVVGTGLDPAVSFGYKSAGDLASELAELTG